MTDIHDIRIIRARSALVTRAPFYGALALGLELVRDDSKDCTAWTDGAKLGYGPAFLDTCTEKQLLGLVAHEVSHVSMKHHTRRGNRDAEQWNEACDYAINRDLFAQGFELPAGALYDPQFDGLSAEEIFRIRAKLPRKPKSKPAPGQIRDAAKPGDKAGLAAAEAETDIRVRQAIGVAKRAAGGAGKLPASIQALIKELADPRIDWRALFRRFVDSQNKANYTWSRPNRRFAHAGMIMPSTCPEFANHIGFGIDISSSMDRSVLREVNAEMQAVLDEGVCDKVTVIYFNAAVTGSKEYARGDTIDAIPSPCGGTRFSPAFKWFSDNAPDLTAILMLTDGDCADYGEEPACPVLWGLYGDPRDVKKYGARLPWGELIEVVAE